MLPQILGNYSRKYLKNVAKVDGESFKPIADIFRCELIVHIGWGKSVLKQDQAAP